MRRALKWTTTTMLQLWTTSNFASTVKGADCSAPISRSFINLTVFDRLSAPRNLLDLLWRDPGGVTDSLFGKSALFVTSLCLLFIILGSWSLCNLFKYLLCLLVIYPLSVNTSYDTTRPSSAVLTLSMVPFRSQSRVTNFVNGPFPQFYIRSYFFCFCL